MSICYVYMYIYLSVYYSVYSSKGLINSPQEEELSFLFHSDIRLISCFSFQWVNEPFINIHQLFIFFFLWKRYFWNICRYLINIKFKKFLANDVSHVQDILPIQALIYTSRMEETFFNLSRFSHFNFRRGIVPCIRVVYTKNYIFIVSIIFASLILLKDSIDNI